MSIVLAAVAQAQALRASKTARLAVPTPSLASRGRWHVFRWSLLGLAVFGAAMLAGALFRSGPVAPQPVPPPPDTAIASMAPLPVPVPDRASARSPQVPAPRVGPPVADAAAFVATSLPPRQAVPVPTAAKFKAPTTLSQPLPVPTGVLPVGSTPGRVPPAPAFEGPPGPAALPVVATAAPDRPPVAVEAPLRPLTDLPPELQSAVQQLHVRLHMFSPSRRQRFIVVEGRQLREGDELADGLRVEEIKQTGVVLRHRDTRVQAVAGAGS